jgi:hypothetical protein
VKFSSDKFEVGWVIGPWVRIGQYEVGIGTYTVADVEAILYDGFEGENAVVLTGETKRSGSWKYLNRRPTINGGWTRAFSFGGRTLYLIKDQP